MLSSTSSTAIATTALGGDGGANAAGSGVITLLSAVGIAAPEGVIPTEQVKGDEGMLGRDGEEGEEGCARFLLW